MGETVTPQVSVAGLAEIVLNVHDMTASLALYRDLLGLKVISLPTMDSPVFLQAGTCGAGLPAMVVLVQLPPAAAATAFSPPRPLHHLALAVAAADFDAAATALTVAGYSLRTGQHPVIASRTLYIDDPDGNEVELIAPLEE